MRLEQTEQTTFLNQVDSEDTAARDSLESS